MQPVAGPSGSPVAGPSGAPEITGPSGPPVTGPSGPPADVNPAQFDPLAEIEDARARRQHREERLETLENKRNKARVNVYLFLAITVILGIFSFFPQTFGDNDTNPQAGMYQDQAETWFANGGTEPDKIWDGETDEHTSPYKNIFIPGWPLNSSLTDVRVDVTIVSWRAAPPTDLIIALYDGECGVNSNRNHAELPEESWHFSQVEMGPGDSIEVTLHTQPGQKCFIAFWDQPVDNIDIRATMDIEVSVYWYRMFTIPAGIICFLLAGFAFIGAQKTGNAFKALKYPEGRPEKKVEEEVLEAAEAEQRGDQLGVPEVEAPEDADTADVEGPSLAEAAASPEQDSPEPETASPDDETVADETPTEEPEQAESTASAWSDEQLLGAGWTQEQIDAMRNG